MLARLARRMPLAALLCALLVALLPAAAADAWPRTFGPVAGNPADKLLAVPIEDSVYDPATKCSKKPKPGTEALIAWLEEHAEGESWGSYRCERWGRRSASLHAENRAVDWHLDAASGADRREADRLIALLLAPDRAGNEQALARRMGVEEIIWNCGYWGAGMDGPRPYSACLNRKGLINRKIDPTTAHRDHLHLGLTKAGAAARTSFWRVHQAKTSNFDHVHYHREVSGFDHY
jgi:hypothetical protein